MFHTAYNNLGKFEPGTNYNLKVEMPAIVRAVKPIEYSKQSGKPGQSIFLEDNTGVKQWVKLTGTFEPLDDSYIGKTFTFKIWPFKPDQSPKTFLYCWIQRQVPQNAQQSNTQTPQTPPQHPNQSQGIDITAQFIALAERLIQAVEYVVHGHIETGGNPNYVGDHPEKPTDEIPF